MHVSVLAIWQEAYKETQSLHLPRLLLSFCNSLTHHVKRVSDAELLACLQLIAKIFSHVQSPVTSSTSDVVSLRTAKSPDSKVGDQLETAEKQSVNSSDVTTVNASDNSAVEHRWQVLPCAVNVNLMWLFVTDRPCVGPRAITLYPFTFPPSTLFF